jgi:hypothetical protein
MNSPTFDVVNVTPEIAKDLLKKNISNRPLKRSRISQLADALNRGEWKLTPQGISLSTEGVLLDGQHRLAAIIKTNKSADLVIAKDVDPSVFTILDTSLKRSAGDSIFLGAESRANIRGLHNTLAAGIRGYANYTRYPTVAWGGACPGPSNDSVLGIFRKNEAKWAHITKTCKRFWSKFRPLPLSSSIAVWMVGIDNNWSMDDMEKFFTALATGAGLEAESSTLAYRNYITNLYTNKVRPKGNMSQVGISSLIRVFNDEKKDVKRKVFYVSRKLIPLPMMLDKVDMGLAPEVLKIVRG